VIAAVLGLSPTEGYAVILAGLGGLTAVLALVVRWVRRPAPDPRPAEASGPPARP